jgi:hypothetical protein
MIPTSVQDTTCENTISNIKFILNNKNYLPQDSQRAIKEVPYQ